MLEQSLSASDGATPDTASDVAPVAGKESDDSDNGDPSEGPGNVALALVSQTLAAALGLPTVTPPMAAPNAGSAATEESVNGITDSAQPASSSPIQELVSLLQATDAPPPQSDAAADKSASTPPSPADGSTTGPASLAHLGMAAHLAVQRPQADSATTTGELRTPVGTAAWNDELGSHLTWMTHQGVESGSLRLSPEHLGPVEVSISVQNGDASVWFGATQADTRAALERALPHLRAMFASQGMTLSDSGVSRESPRNQSGGGTTGTSAPVSAVHGVDLPSSSGGRSLLGLVDTYA